MKDPNARPSSGQIWELVEEQIQEAQERIKGADRGERKRAAVIHALAALPLPLPGIPAPLRAVAMGLVVEVGVNAYKKLVAQRKNGSLLRRRVAEREAQILGLEAELEVLLKANSALTPEAKPAKKKKAPDG
jgi:hypothetical protein